MAIDIVISNINNKLFIIEKYTSKTKYMIVDNLPKYKIRVKYVMCDSLLP